MEHRSPEERRRTRHPPWERPRQHSDWQQLLEQNYLGRYASIEAFAALFIEENSLMDRVEPAWLRPFLTFDLPSVAKLLTSGMIVVSDPEGGVHLFEDPDVDGKSPAL